MSLISSIVQRFGPHNKCIFSLRLSATRGRSLSCPDHVKSAAVPPEHRHNLRVKSQNQLRLFSSTRSLSTEDTKTYILSTIGENKIAIFSKTYCPFCDKTKKLFRTLGEDAKILELDERPDGGIIQEELAKMTGQRSVPNVFVNGRHVGGNDDCQALARSGKLHEMLQEMGKVHTYKS